MILLIYLVLLIFLVYLYLKNSKEKFEISSRLHNFLKLDYEDKNGKNYFTAKQRNINITNTLINSA